MTLPFAAPPITANLGGPAEQPIRFRRAFSISPGLLSAELRVSALGIYTAECNGSVINDESLAPGWTVYRDRIRLQSADVTHLLQPGSNAIGITVAEGWWRGRLGFGEGRREVYGTEIGPMAELLLRYNDRTEIVATDVEWRASYGPITFASLYDGEHVDARLNQPGWSAADFDDTDWSTVDLLDDVSDRLETPLGPPVRPVEELSVREVITSTSGATILDFGQNFSGRVRVRVEAVAGTEIMLRHAEVLDDGELGTRPLRGAAQTDRYITAGTGIETYEPTFTIHGFRYVEVTGWPGTLDSASFTGVVCHSDMERTGWFECSHDGLNQLHENVRWGMRGNFVDLPTDCPQRNERLGWTGDICVFAPTAAYLYDCESFLASWLADLAAEQADLGFVPSYVPFVSLFLPSRPTAVWGDAAVVVPWVLYERFGSTTVLEAQWDSMQAWVDNVIELVGDNHLWDTGFQFGDWLDPAAPPDNPSAARTDRHLVATAYHAHTTALLAKAARVLGRDTDAERYEAHAANVRRAFVHEYVTPSGRMASDAQAAYALAICYDLFDSAEQRDRAGQRLARLVTMEDFHIGTGFAGTPLVCDALARTGHLDTAYHLLLQDSCPSWLYPVTMGATTIWERWDSMLPDGSINPGEMTSFNHYALGAVADFLHRTVAGLAPASPGYAKLRVAPRPGGGLSHASATLHTRHGRASVAWRREGGQLHVDVEVPAGVTAEVDIDGCSVTSLNTGRHNFSTPYRDPTQDPARPDTWTAFSGE